MEGIKKFAIQIIFLALVIVGALYFGFNPGALNQVVPVTQPMTERQLKVGSVVLDVEIADTVSKRNQGLGGREKLEINSGMLFVFPKEDRYRFWMKRMKFPIDMIFIKNGEVVDVLQNVPPPPAGQADSSLTVYEPVVPVDMVLEVNAGFVTERSIRVGDKVLLLQE